ncbi:NAD(P)-binding protein [Aulographum hederae CBS 113979]|uniref:NAD(P)-binding protein n=1 Tax=Aulographum hederae CBS 113979 TaxID=1176131 RepID=A0A6G1GPY7_9PEZI|nr:NAD(P)-binding protein [Aulographum hederae CBS 113979]
MLGPPTSHYYPHHVHPRGINDARPTALTIIHDSHLTSALPQKTILITGGATSIGLETARALHATGATVYITSRDVRKGEEAVEDIMSSDPTNKAPVHVIEMDLESFSSVREGARKFLELSGGKLNILICNTGVMAIPFSLTQDGFEKQFQVNYLSHFLLFQLLKPALLSSASSSSSAERNPSSRVVVLTSESHRQGQVRISDYNFTEAGSYHPMKSYAQSKTACIYLANNMTRLFSSSNLHATSVHPGAIRSGLTSHLAAMTAPLWKIPAVKCREKSAAQGAATSVYAAVSQEWEGRGGRYLSNCMEMGPWEGKEGFEVMDEGFAPWAYDREVEERIWGDSLRMVGLEGEGGS